MSNAPLSDAERRVLYTIDAEALAASLANLVEVPSTANRETPAQRRIAEQMRTLGLELDVWDIDFEELKRHPAYSSDLERCEGMGVVGTWRGQGGGRALILNGHIDVVEAGELDRWTHPPYELTRDGDRLWGRGSCDMKGGLACALAAVRALQEAGIRLRGDLQIQSVIGEEDGGAGALATILRGHTGDGAIVLEPTNFALAPAQAGALSFRLSVPGAAAHGALREEGVDPLEKFIPIFHALRALEAKRNRDVAEPLFRDEALPYALCMGRIEAGIWPSSVAETLVAEGRYGVAAGEDLDCARAELEDAVAAVAAQDSWMAEHPPTVEWWGARFEGARTPDDDPIVEAVAQAGLAVTGSELPRAGMRYGADMRLLVNQGGIPTVLFGAGEIRVAHRENEHTSLADLVQATRIVTLTAMRFCGVTGE